MLISTDKLITGSPQCESGGPGWVRTEGPEVAEVGRGSIDGADAHAAILVPGFVDTHVHGAKGATFSTDDAAEAELAARSHWAMGATTLYGSLVTGSLATLERQIRTLVPLCERGDLAGIHLEGPWLSPKHRGAHDPELLIDPRLDDIDRLIEAGEGHIRMVTLAPELDGGMDAVRHISARGITAALGHSAADDEVAAAAIDAGITVATHLCNAMPGIHHRRPGPIPVLLADSRVSVEMIGDGIHIDPRIIRLGFDASEHRFMFVSDAMSATGMADGDYVLGALPVSVREGTARISDTGAIAGSTRPLAGALTACAEAGMSLPQLVRAMSSTPDATHSLDAGEIAEGRRADLVLLTEDRRVERVLRRGRWIG